MIIQRLLPVILSCFFITSCESVSSLHPLGNKPVKLSQEKWQGSWIVDDSGVIHTKVVDADKGELLLVLVELERSDKNEWLETHPVLVRKSGNTYYFNLVEKGNDRVEYFFGKFSREGNMIKILLPSYETVARKVSAGEIAGKVNKDSNSVILNGNKTELNAFIEANQDIFSEKEATVLRKVGK